MTNNEHPIITVTEEPIVRNTREGTSVRHEVAVDCDVLGWVIERRNFDGSVYGWGIWGYDLDGVFASLDDAARWIVEYL